MPAGKGNRCLSPKKKSALSCKKRRTGGLYSKFSDFTADQFYDWVNKGEYLLIPLMLLLIGIAFALFLRLTHATLLLIAEMKADDVKKILEKINNKTLIKDKTIDIVKMLIDIVLDSVISILKFVTFIPNFSTMIYDFVFGDESTDTEDE